MKSSTGISEKQLWKLRKKMCPNNRDPPSAMFDKHGNLVTSDRSIESRALEAYTERLENNEMKPHLKDYEENVNELCELRLKLCKSNKTDP